MSPLFGYKDKLAEGSISQEEYEQILEVARAVTAEHLENVEVEREKEREREEDGGASADDDEAGPAVKWVPDSEAPECMRCQAKFTLMNRRCVQLLHIRTQRALGRRKRTQWLHRILSQKCAT